MSLETEITFYNKAKLRVGILIAKSMHYDIYCKNGATGWEIARKLNNEAKTLTLSQQKGRYVIT